MHDLPIITHSGIHILSYVDEITIFSQHWNPHIDAAHLQEYINIETIASLKQNESLPLKIHTHTNHTLVLWIKYTSHNNTQQHTHTLHQHGRHTTGECGSNHIQTTSTPTQNPASTSSEHSLSTFGQSKKKTLPWCSNSASGSYSHTLTLYGNRT